MQNGILNEVKKQEPQVAYPCINLNSSIDLHTNLKK